MSGPRLTRAFARNATESAYPNLWRGLVAAWAPPGAPRHATRLWDYSGNGNHGTLRNGATWTPGKQGRAVSFDGTDDDVIGDTPGKNFPSGNQSRTVACWIKSSGWSGDRGLLHWGTDGTSPTAANFHLVAGSSGTILWGNGFGHGILTGNIHCNDSRWHSVVGSYESSTGVATIYIDSVKDTSGSLTYAPNTGTNNNWSIGKFLSGSGTYPGLLCAMLLYNRSWVKSDVIAFHDLCVPTICSRKHFALKYATKASSFSSISV